VPMVKTLQRLSDRLVERVVPRVPAKAAPTCCESPGSCWWGAHCYCAGTRGYRNYCCCTSSYQCSCYCRYAGQYC
jgi:hypothetical protein